MVANVDWELQGGEKAEGWGWGGYTEKWDGLARKALAGGNHSLKLPAQITWRLTGWVYVGSGDNPCFGDLVLFCDIS